MERIDVEGALLASFVEFPEVRHLIHLIDPKYLSEETRAIYLIVKDNITLDGHQIMMKVLNKGLPLKFYDHLPQNPVSGELLIKEFHNNTQRIKLANTMTDLGKKLAQGMAIEEAIQIVWEFQKGFGNLEIKTAEMVAKEYSEEIHAFLSGNVSGIEWPYRKLNQLVNPLTGGELVIIAGQTGMGKTAFMLNVGYLWALKHKRVGFIALEMKAKTLENRIHQRQFDFSLSKHRYLLNSRPDEKAKLDEAIEKFKKIPMFFVDSGRSGISEVLASIKTMHTINGVDVVFVDYLQLLRGRGENRVNEIGDITRALKQLAMELDIPIIVGSQLNRSTEQNEGGRPRLSNLRESGNIEQDADLVMFVYRPFFYSKRNEDVPETDFEIIVGKQRNGMLGDVPMFYDTQKQLISEVGYED